MIDTELAAFLQEGVGIHIASRNAALEPNGSRALAVKVDADGRHLEVYLAAVAAARILPDLQANGQAAVGFGRPVDDRSCQVKGLFLGVRDATARWALGHCHLMRDRFTVADLAFFMGIWEPSDVDAGFAW
jgi:hypothetical protein